jgi:hypothetical protein
MDSSLARRKSRTSVCRRSTSSTRKMPHNRSSARKSLSGAAADAAAAAAVAVDAAGEAAGAVAVAEAAACPGDVAAGARSHEAGGLFLNSRWWVGSGVRPTRPWPAMICLASSTKTGLQKPNCASGHNKRPRHWKPGPVSHGGKVLPLTKKSGPARQKSLSLITAYLREYGAKILESYLPRSALKSGS